MNAKPIHDPHEKMNLVWKTNSSQIRYSLQTYCCKFYSNITSQGGHYRAMKVGCTINNVPRDVSISIAENSVLVCKLNGYLHIQPREIRMQCEKGRYIDIYYDCLHWILNSLQSRMQENILPWRCRKCVQLYDYTVHTISIIIQDRLSE